LLPGPLSGGRGPGAADRLGFEKGPDGTLNGGRGPGPADTLGFGNGPDGTLKGGRYGTAPLADTTVDAAEVSAFDTWLTTEVKALAIGAGKADTAPLTADTAVCATAAPTADTLGDTPAAAP
jgi:hypothetical protein